MIVPVTSAFEFVVPVMVPDHWPSVFGHEVPASGVPPPLEEPEDPPLDDEPVDEPLLDEEPLLPLPDDDDLPPEELPEDEPRIRRSSPPSSRSRGCRGSARSEWGRRRCRRGEGERRGRASGVAERSCPRCRKGCADREESLRTGGFVEIRGETGGRGWVRGD